MDIETLIAEVQKRKYLWDITDEQYKNKSLIAQGWEDIGEILSISSNDAKKKWRNLRDTFRRELKRIHKSNVVAPADKEPTYNGKWQFFENFLFLRESMNLNGIEENVTEFAEVMLKNEWNIAEDTMNSTDIENPISPKASSCSSITHCSAKKRRSETLNEKSLTMEAEKDDLLKTEEDDNLLFFRSLLPYMKKLSPLQQLKIRNKLSNDIMVELEKT